MKQLYTEASNRVATLLIFGEERKELARLFNELSKIS